MQLNAIVNPSSLIFLIGLPGSGKSTIARSILTNFPHGVLISTDAIRDQLFGNEAIQGAWLKIWLEIRQQFLCTVDQMTQGRVSYTIYDATNAVRKQRRAAIDLARKCGFTDITGVWIDVPLEVCLTRNAARSRVVPEAVILRMHRRLMGAPPAVEDGFDRLIKMQKSCADRVI